MKLIIFILLGSLAAIPIHAKNTLGRFAHLSKFAGSEDIDLIYDDEEVKNLLTREFYIDIEKFKSEREDWSRQIDVIKGNMILESYVQQNPCSSSTFMSISLTDNDEVYLIKLRNNKISIFHTIFGQRTKDIKNIRLSKESILYINKMVKECKSKAISRT